MQEFTLEGYRTLLARFRSYGYEYRLLTDLVDSKWIAAQSVIYLRHDIDIDLKFALQIARLEKQENISSVFFVALRSPFYNALDLRNIQVVNEIHGLGHVIAPHVLLPTDTDLTESVEFDLKLMEDVYPFVNRHLVSVHSPIDFEQLKGLKHIAGIERVYGPVMSQQLFYFSDSGCCWRFGHPCDAQAYVEHRPIQLLTHPFWWVQEGDTPIQKLHNYFMDRQRGFVKEYSAFFPKLLSSQGQ